LQIPAEVSLSRVNLRFDDEEEATGIESTHHSPLTNTTTCKAVK